MAEQDGFIGRVEQGVRAALAGQLPAGLKASRVLDEAGLYLTTAPGAKRARPRLVREFARLVGAEDQVEALAQIAVCAEFIHGASLLHDDVVDEGTERRGRPTVNARWSNAVAVLGGDVMLCAAIMALERLPRSLTRDAVRVVASMSRAAVVEVERRGRADTTLALWESIASGKTGALFGFCGRAPALLVGDERAARRFSVCGERLGVAFQLADDVRDLVDDRSGKDRFADIMNRNPSHPLLWAAARDDGFGAALERAWSRPEPIERDQARSIGERAIGLGALEASRRAMSEAIEAAFEALGPMREEPGARDLAAWAFGLSRTYLGEASAAS